MHTFIHFKRLPNPKFLHLSVRKIKSMTGAPKRQSSKEFVTYCHTSLLRKLACCVLLLLVCSLHHFLWWLSQQAAVFIGKGCWFVVLHE